MTTTMNETDELVRYSRRSLWTALVLMLLIGGSAAASIGFPDSAAGALFSRLAIPLPIIIVIATAALKASAKKASTDPAGPAMRAVLNDELRQASVNRAYRNGFVGAMVLQPLLAIALTLIVVAYPVAFAACLTVVTGVVVMLASILYYDR